MTTMTRDTPITVGDLSAAMAARKKAEKEYWELIEEAKAEGWSNTRIAGAVGVSEAAIRLYMVRHGKVTVY